MINVKSTIKLNAAFMKQLDQAGVRALEQTAEALHTEVVQAEVVPRMDGTLQNEAFFVDTSRSQSGSVSLVHSTPYARRLYFHPEYHFRHEAWEEDVKDNDGKVHHLTHQGNPNAKGKWFEDWLPGGKESDFAKRTFAALYRRLTGL
jgi:hypothetical protein